MQLRPALLLLAACALASTGAPVQAQERRLYLESFEATIDVESGGTVDVREELSFRFEGAWNGVFRSIPVVYDVGPARRRIRLDVVDARDESGERLRHEVSRQGPYREVKVWVPDARDTRRTIVLHYRVRDALGFHEEHDELYWNVTGNEWDVPVESASARVILPEGATGRRAAAYTGAYGERGDGADVQEIEEGFFFSTRDPLAFREGMTVVVGWDRGLVHRPGPLERALAAGAFLLLLPLVSFFGMWRLWAVRGRDPARRPVSPRYDPPEDLSPAEAGTLLDNRPDVRDLTAGIVDLAVRGYLVIEEEERTGLGRVFGKDQFRFRRRNPVDEGLRTHERQLLTALFDGSDETSTEDLEHEFYKALPDIKSAIFDRLRAAGYYHRRPDKVLQTYVGIGAPLLALATVGLIALANARGYSPLIGLIAGVGTGLPVLLFGFFMPARTVLGTRRLEETLGFEEFLDRVESDRFRRMIRGPEQFEAYLPFAMAFGVEEQWARAFEDIYRQAPDWYVGSSGASFRPTHFVSSLDTMASRTGSAMQSAPRSSGSSGFSSGGGFSGGGVGGGGGGGF